LGACLGLLDLHIDPAQHRQHEARGLAAAVVGLRIMDTRQVEMKPGHALWDATAQISSTRGCVRLSPQKV